MPQFETGSTRKLSISGIVAPQQTRVTTADDINNLLGTVAKTTEEVVKVVDNETLTAKSRRYNEARANYSNGLAQANGDPFKTNEIWNKFKRDTQALVDEGGFINEQSQNSFQGIVLNEVASRELYHNNIQKQYSIARYQDGSAERLVAFNGNIKDFYKSEREVAKLNNVTDMNLVGETVVKNLTNKMIIELKGEPNITDEMLDSYSNQFKELSTIDPHLKGKDYYNDAMVKIEAFKDIKQATDEALFSTSITKGMFNTDLKGFNEQLNKLNLSGAKKETYKVLQKAQQENFIEGEQQKTFTLAMEAKEEWGAVYKLGKSAGYNEEQLAYYKTIYEKKLVKAEDELILKGLKTHQALVKHTIDNGMFTGDPNEILENSARINGEFSKDDFNYFERATFQNLANTSSNVVFSKNKSAYPASVHGDYDKLAKTHATNLLIDMEEKGITSGALDNYLKHIKTTGQGGENSKFIGNLLSVSNIKQYRTQPNSKEATEALVNFRNRLGTIDNMVGTITAHDSTILSKVFNKEQLNRFDLYRALDTMGMLSIDNIEKIDTLNISGLQELSTDDNDKINKLLVDNGVPAYEWDDYKKQLKTIYTLQGSTDNYLTTLENRFESAYKSDIIKFKNAKDTDGKPLVISKDTEQSVETMLSILRGDIVDVRDVKGFNFKYTPIRLTQNIADFIANKGKFESFKLNVKDGKGNSLVGVYKDVTKVSYDAQSGGVYLGNDKDSKKYFMQVTPREFLDFSTKIVAEAETQFRGAFTFTGLALDFKDAMEQPNMTAKDRAKRVKRVVTGKDE